MIINQSHIAAVRRSIAIFALIVATASVYAQPAEIPDSTIVASAELIDTIAPAPKKKNIVQRIIAYFSDSNKEKPNKPFDFSIIGGPYYSSETKLSLGIVAAGIYKDVTDTITPPSNVSLYGQASIVGFYTIGIRGNQIFRDDRHRINYDIYFYNFPREFWGIGYDSAIHYSHSTKFKQLYFQATADFLTRLTKGFYIGPSIAYTYSSAHNVKKPAFWNGQALNISTLGVGAKLQYDTRDNLTGPERGTLIQFEQRFCPKFLFNDYAFSFTELNLCQYIPAWKGCTIASRYHAMISYGNVPWNMMATFGGSENMRGYYDGRFRDKSEMDLTVEFRQHVWRRNGIVVWGGLGTVFDKFNELRLNRLLPCGGIGYRWEFKRHTNVRLDFGFGKGETAFIFGINEAF